MNKPANLQHERIIEATQVANGLTSNRREWVDANYSLQVRENPKIQ
jgi:hypothetical protein